MPAERDFSALRARIQAERSRIEAITFRRPLPPGTEQPALNELQRRRIELKWAERPPEVVEPGARINCRLELYNRMARSLASALPHPVQLAWRWARSGEGKRVPLPALLEGGEMVAISLRLDAPRTIGEQVLQVVIVQEGVSWFEDLPTGHVEALCRVRRA